ncbi:MAG: GNAT family N-acetyltransferase [Candidatus Binatia bacterium]
MNAPTAIDPKTQWAYHGQLRPVVTHARPLSTRRLSDYRWAMATRIETPTQADALTEFLVFHDEVYGYRTARWTAHVPFQLPILTGESPFARDRVLRPFVARDRGRIVARAVAAIDRRYQRHWNERLGHLLMFEALPDTREATRLLVNAACEWLEAQGATAARAGMGMLDFPFVVDDYDTLPPGFLRQNPAYYQTLLKDAGFETERGFVDYRIAVRPDLVARWESALEAARRNGFEIVPLKDLPDARRVVEFTALYNDTFKAHWGFTPFTEDEVAEMTEALTPVGMLETSLIAYREGAPVGVLWVTPDTSFLAALAPGRTLRGEEKVNFLGIGVHESARGRGLNLGMAAHAYLDLAGQGCTHVSYTLVLDDNWPSRRTAEKLGAHVCANYLAYRRNFRH